jgi:hypothetical protein
VPSFAGRAQKELNLELLELKYVNLDEYDAMALFIYFAVIKEVQPNKTLKPLCLCNLTPVMTKDEADDMTSLLVKQNYGLESLLCINSDERMGMCVPSCG